MDKKEFFDDQKPITASKILIYKQYMSSYIPKVLMTYGKCCIADLFCGRGKNGDKDGSPLVLLDIAKKTLENPIFKQKHPDLEIIIVFSDANPEYCLDLTNHLKKMPLPPEIKVLGPFCEEFKTVKIKAINYFNTIRAPKFFFLDPFKYAQICIDEIKELMSIKEVEVLLFSPTFHAYRFVKCAEDNPVLARYLNDYTDKGCIDYLNITEFNESIRKKLLTYLGLRYVRVIRLDDGSCKNALFYLTKHISGMLLMNKIVWKNAEDGIMISTKSDNEPALIDLKTVTKNYMKNKEFLRNFVKNKGIISNTEIMDFVAQEGFDTSYANVVLKEMKKNNEISVEYLKKDKTTGFYVGDSNWNDHLCDIKYIGA